MTHHQYGISVLVSQMSFHRETSGWVVKSRLFSQAKQYAKQCFSLVYKPSYNQKITLLVIRM